MRVINALPYNAPAKPIERWFGDFESRYLSTLPGWISGNRMNKRQEAIGRTVAPYGTFEDFVPAFFGLLKAYHSVPTGKQSGLKRLSPNTSFQRYSMSALTAKPATPDKAPDRSADPKMIAVSGRPAARHRGVGVRQFGKEADPTGIQVPPADHRERGRPTGATGSGFPYRSWAASPPDRKAGVGGPLCGSRQPP
ncbi:hypothetical protein [Mesorhizobium sp. Root172]|jgi:hypothetical protein|uniref:hypothetical protein n=1 Tax=Mesorhizobium sp. Root172 TaxID=1736481 RepID=UPI000AF3CE42|nr:hypothetical protein [Mesorhizobium sp. Root172]